MSCIDSDKLAELADRGRKGLEIPPDVMAHAAACEVCDHALTSLKNLGEALDSLAAVHRDLSAPEHVEERLRAEFRSWRGESGAAAKSPRGIATRVSVQRRVPSSIMTPRIRPPVGAPMATALRIAVAACVVLLAAVLIFEWKQIFPRPQTNTEVAGQVNRIGGGSGMPQPGPRHGGATQTVAPKSQPKGQSPESGSENIPERAGNRRQVEGSGAAPGPQPRLAEERGDLPSDRHIVPADRGSSTAPDESAMPEGDSEIATDFFPIASDIAAPAGDSGSVFRVEVPSLVLARYGLPFDPAHADRPIQADVLVGSDGLARAIRFVR